jgi:hypothetical protein
VGTDEVSTCEFDVLTDVVVAYFVVVAVGTIVDKMEDNGGWIPAVVVTKTMIMKCCFVLNMLRCRELFWKHVMLMNTNYYWHLLIKAFI